MLSVASASFAQNNTVFYVLNGDKTRLSSFRQSHGKNKFIEVVNIPKISRRSFKHLCSTFSGSEYLTADGDAGLVLAHFKGWQRLLSEPPHVEQAVIFEDDEILTDRFWNKLDCVLGMQFDWINLNPLRPGEWNVDFSSVCDNLKVKAHHHRSCIGNNRDAWLGAYAVKRTFLPTLIWRVRGQNISKFPFDHIVATGICELNPAMYNMISLKTNSLSEHGPEGMKSLRKRTKSRKMLCSQHDHPP